MSREYTGTPEYRPENTTELSSPSASVESFRPTPGEPTVKPTMLIPTEISALDARPEVIDADSIPRDDAIALKRKMLRTPEAAADILPAGFDPWKQRDAENAKRFADAVRQAPVIGRHMLVGGHILTDEYRDKAVTQVRSEQRQQVRSEYPRTVKPSEEEREAAALIGAGADALSERLGIPINHDDPHAYILDTPEHLHDAYAQISGGTRPSPALIGFYGDRCGMFIARTACQDFARTIAHESAHAASVAMHIVYDNDEGELPIAIRDYVTTGYRRPDVASGNHPTGLNEAVVQLAAIRMLKEVGYPKPFWYAHAGSTILLDAVIQYTAQEHAKSPEEIDDALVKGLFNGDLTGAQLIRGALGKPAWARYTSMHYLGDARDDMIAALSAINFDDPRITHTAIASLEHALQGGAFQLFDWLR